MKPSARLILALISFLPLAVKTQTVSKNGSVFTSNGKEISDSLKLSKGKLISLSSINLRKEYKPADVQSFIIDNLRYISYSNDFYKEIDSGNKAVLYQKISDNSREKNFNGPEVVGFLTTTEGRIGDYYVRLAGETKLDLITKKTFGNYFTKLFASNDSMVSKITTGALGYDQIKDAVDFYNTY